MDKDGEGQKNNENNDNSGPTMSVNDSELTIGHADSHEGDNNDIPMFIDTATTNIAAAAAMAPATAPDGVDRSRRRDGFENDDADDISSVTGTIMRHHHSAEGDLEDTKERYRRQIASRMYQDEAHRQRSPQQQPQQQQQQMNSLVTPAVPINELRSPTPSVSSSLASAVNSDNQITPQAHKRQLLKQMQHSQYVPPVSVTPSSGHDGGDGDSNATPTNPPTDADGHQHKSLPTAELVVDHEDVEAGVAPSSMINETKAQLKTLHKSVSQTERSDTSHTPAIATAVAEIAIEETGGRRPKHGNDGPSSNRKRMVTISMAFASLLLLMGVAMGILAATGTFSSSTNSELENASGDEKEAVVPTSPTMAPTTGPTSIFQQIDPSSIEWQQMGDDITSLGGGVTAQEFGKSVAMSSNGNIVAIGSPDSNFSTGHVQIHVWDEQGKRWNARGSLLTGDDVGDRFGYSVAMNDDATTLAIGSIGYQNNVGSVRILQWSTLDSNWIPMIVEGVGESDSLQGLFTGDRDKPNSYFGRSVSFNANGSVLAIGASAFMMSDDEGSGNNDGYARVFHFDDIQQKWIQRGADLVGGVAGERTPDQNIGTSVSLSDDGTACAIGTPSFLNSLGATIIFRYDPSLRGSWDRILVVKAEKNYDINIEYAGINGVVSGDGQFSCSGSTAGFIRMGRYVPSRGLYVLDWGNFYGIDDEGPILHKDEPSSTVSGETVSMVQISNDHFVIAWGVYSEDVNDETSSTPGYVTLYSYQPGPEETLAGTWKEIGSPSRLHGDEVGDKFGSSTALSKDGATLVVGASQGNYVRVFRATTSSAV